MDGNPCASVEERSACSAENYAKNPRVDLDDIRDKEQNNPGDGSGDECRAPPASEN
jgi:hypothetical protein